MRARHRVAALFIAALAPALAASPMFGTPVADAQPTPRIVGGDPVDWSTVPYVVALLDSSVADPFQAHFCGGSLVGPSWVLTAAHCVSGSNPTSIQVAWGHSLLSEITPADRHTVTQVVVHPAYSATTHIADVALLQLAVPAGGAAPIEPWGSEFSPTLGETLQTYGWGNTSATGTNYPDELRGVDLVDRAGPTGPCGMYGTDYISFHMLCAGVAAGGKDACSGDSGGPLVKQSAFGPLLVGVTSWGNGCAQADYPGIWSRVSTYHPWILKTINAVPVTVGVGDVAIMEGASGTRPVKFTVSLSRKSSTTVTVPYSTVSGTALAGVDFIARSGTLTFIPGVVSKLVTVQVKGDTDIEFPERFTLQLGAPTGGAQHLNPPWSTDGEALILADSDYSETPFASVSDIALYEGDAHKTRVASVTIALSRPAIAPITIQYTTVGDTAISGNDYTAKSGTLTFPTGSRTKSVTIAILPDYYQEFEFGDEQFTVEIVGTTGLVGIEQGVGIVTILGDDD